jgi:nucleoside-diphosphate-sugar epimerase
VNTFIAQALRGEPVTVYGDGSQTRSFCHVEDQVSGLLALLASRHEGPVNLGNPEEISIVDLAHLIIELVGSESDVRLLPLPFERTGDPVRRCPDIGLARSELGWEPLVSLQDGLASMIGYYKASEDLG